MQQTQAISLLKKVLHTIAEIEALYLPKSQNFANKGLAKVIPDVALDR